MPGEDAHLAQALVDLIAAFDLREIAVQAFHRDIRRNVLEVSAGARLLNRGRGDIGGKDLHGKDAAGFIQVFADRYGDGERLFSRGATRHPDANRIVRVPVLEKAREDSFLQAFERLRIPEEARYADEQIAL